MAEALAAGADQLLAKPITGEALVSRLTRALAARGYDALRAKA